MIKKIVSVAAVAIIITIAAINVNISTNHTAVSKASVQLAGIEALAQNNNETGENPFAGFQVGYSQGYSLIWDGLNFGLNTFLLGFKTITCCLRSSEMNACNFYMEDPECGRVVR